MLRIYDWIEFGDRCWNWKVDSNSHYGLGHRPPGVLTRRPDVVHNENCWKVEVEVGVEVGGCMFRRSVVMIAISGKMPSPAELERVCLAFIGTAQTLLDRSN
jgi:hypothetical protein